MEAEGSVSGFSYSLSESLGGSGGGCGELPEWDGASERCFGAAVF
jgi:hypothetical protein